MKDQLATPGATTEPIRLLREHVFNRLRLPDYKDSNQASTKYMPRLSGNDGDAREPGQHLGKGEPTVKRFAALTKLQYQRFSEWKDGQFSANPAPWSTYNSFEQVPLFLQPIFLTRAALEHTVGEPLYPGIEVHWSAREPEMYDFTHTNISVNEPPFRFNRRVLPGHIGRGLSLPWQSDFAMCETHWWPSIRPDDVINFLDWPVTLDIVSEDKFVKEIAPKRIKWTRGMRESPAHPSAYYPGNTDMVRHWQKLGFVAKVPIVIGDKDLPVWLENERMPIDDIAPAFEL